MTDHRTPEAALLTYCLRQEPEYRRLAGRLSVFRAAGEKFRDDPCLVTGLCDTPRTALAAALALDPSVAGEGACSLICVPDEKTGYAVLGVLKRYTDEAYVFPARDFIFHHLAASSRDFEYDRLFVLRKLADRQARFLVCTPEAMLTLLAPPARFSGELTLRIGDETDVEQLLESLVGFGYVRADTVEGKGQFARRGDIVDIFPVAQELPVRLEFFGDELDAAGLFDPLTQRRTENVTTVCITPAREVILTADETEKIGAEIDRLIRGAGKRKTLAEKGGDRERCADCDALVERLNAEKAALRAGDLPCLDKYLPAVLPGRVSLPDLVDGCLFLFDLPRVRERLETFEKQIDEAIAHLAAAGEIDPKKAVFCETYGDLARKLREHASVVCNLFSQRASLSYSGMFDFRTKTVSAFTRDVSQLCEELDFYRENRYRVFVCARSEHSAEALCSVLEQRGKHPLRVPADAIASRELPDALYVISAATDLAPFPGFELPTSRVALLTEAAPDLSAAGTRKGRASSKTPAKKILSYADLNVGDYVVHTVHGIGRYEGIKTLTVSGVTRDYISVGYAAGDMIYVPADQLDRVSRYAGSGENVRLSRLGSPDWQKTKTRVKRAAKDMAKELIELYAKRRRLPGYAFSPDTEWQREFEEKFIYEETDGQLQAAREIKRDMEESYPMDRLLCGDVGFGKTEVALRAVFKCVSDGKQAAILVPTTILAWQHYETALSRFCDFPITVDVLSRFKTAKETREIVRRLKTGELDVIIGTHRLLSADVSFKNLGLLIVDEEQRFGVAHKEKLKQLAGNVDVLTLTATPIPRTLNMAMAGIRDMSVLEEAPQDRYPVQTYVIEHDPEVIGEAIRRELRRGGQVFYLRNRVDGIESTAARIRKLAPDANIAVAHGKMDEETLSDIWRRMVGGEIDVLVCTTIIETGVDVPNANTLIIEHADNMGLSQLHQIRGRVGRSNRRAYAYLTYEPYKALSEIAQKRLEAVREYTEFGSGFKIAMRDLEIRGAGNLLGAEQSGHMQAVGYDLYIRLLEEAVLEEKGEKRAQKCDCTVDLGHSAYIPEKYIAQPASRIEAYKRIAAIETDEDAADVTDELLDRYGDLPEPVSQLVWVSSLRAKGESARITRIEIRSGRLNFYPEKPDKEALRALYAEFGKLLLYCASGPYYSLKLQAENEAKPFVERFFRVYARETPERENESAPENGENA